MAYWEGPIYFCAVFIGSGVYQISDEWAARALAASIAEHKIEGANTPVLVVVVSNISILVFLFYLAS